MLQLAVDGVAINFCAFASGIGEKRNEKISNVSGFFVCESERIAL